MGELTGELAERFRKLSERSEQMAAEIAVAETAVATEEVTHRDVAVPSTMNNSMESSKSSSSSSPWSSPSRSTPTSSPPRTSFSPMSSKMKAGGSVGVGAGAISTPSRVIERYAAAIIHQSNSKQSTKLTESEDDNEDEDDDVVGVALVPDEYEYDDGDDDHHSRDNGSDAHNEVSDGCPVSPTSRRNQQSAMLRKARMIRANRHSSTQQKQQNREEEVEVHHEDQPEQQEDDEQQSHPLTNDDPQYHGQDELLAADEDDHDVVVNDSDRLGDVADHTVSANEIVPSTVEDVPDPSDDELDVANGVLSESMVVDDEGDDDVHHQVLTNDNDGNVNVDDDDDEIKKSSSDVEVDDHASPVQEQNESTGIIAPQMETDESEQTAVADEQPKEDTVLKTPDVSFEKNKVHPLHAEDSNIPVQTDKLRMDGLNSDPADLSFRMMSNAQQTPESSNLSKPQVVSSTSAFDSMRKHGKQSLGIRPFRQDATQENDLSKEEGAFFNRPGAAAEEEFLDEKKDDHSLDSKSTFDSDYSGPSQNSWSGSPKRAKKGSRARKGSAVNDNPVGFAVSMAFDTIAGFANDNIDEDIRSRRHRGMRDDDSSVGSGSNIISEMHDALLHAFGCAMKGGASSVLFDDDSIATDTFSDLGSIPASRTTSRNARHKRTSSDQSNSLVTDRSSVVSSTERRSQVLEDDTTTSELADFSKKKKRVRSNGDKPPLPSKGKKSPNRPKGRPSSARESVASSVSTPIYSQDFFGEDKDAVDLLEEADTLFSGEEMLKAANEKVDALVASIQNLLGKPVSTKGDTTVSVSAEKKSSESVSQVSVPNTAEQTTCSGDSGDASEGLDHLRQDLEKAREHLGFTEATGIEAATLVPAVASSVTEATGIEAAALVPGATSSLTEAAGIEAATVVPAAASSFTEAAGIEASTLDPVATSSFTEAAGIEAIALVPAAASESILPNDAVLDRHGFPVDPLHPENENQIEAMFATKQAEKEALSMALSSFSARIEEETDVCVHAEEEKEETNVVEQSLPPPTQNPTSILSAVVPEAESTNQDESEQHISKEEDSSELNIPDTESAIEPKQEEPPLASSRESAMPKAKKSSIAGRFKGLLRPFRKSKNKSKKEGGKVSSVQSTSSSKITSTVENASSLKDKSGPSRIHGTEIVDPQPDPISTSKGDRQLINSDKNMSQSVEFEEKSEKNQTTDETVTTDENWTSFEEVPMSSPLHVVHNTDFTSNLIPSPPRTSTNSSNEDGQTVSKSLSNEENISSKLEFDRSFEVLHAVANKDTVTIPAVPDEQPVLEAKDETTIVGAEFLGDVVEGKAIEEQGGDGWKTPDQSPVQSLVHSPDVNWDHVLKNKDFDVDAEFFPMEEKKEGMA